MILLTLNRRHKMFEKYDLFRHIFIRQESLNNSCQGSNGEWFTRNNMHIVLLVVKLGNNNIYLFRMDHIRKGQSTNDQQYWQLSKWNTCLKTRPPTGELQPSMDMHNYIWNFLYVSNKLSLHSYICRLDHSDIRVARYCICFSSTELYFRDCIFNWSDTHNIYR